MLCFIAVLRASAQKQTSGCISRTVRRRTGSANKSLSTSAIWGTMAQVWTPTLLPMHASLIVWASAKSPAASASRHGTGKTLDLRGVPSTFRARRSHGRIGASRQGNPIGTSMSIRSASENEDAKSSIPERTRYSRPRAPRVTASEPLLQPSTPTCRMILRASPLRVVPAVPDSSVPVLAQHREDCTVPHLFRPCPRRRPRLGVRLRLVYARLSHSKDPGRHAASRCGCPGTP